MNQHEAVTKIANDAITHIREFAIDAMKTVMAVDAVQAETPPAETKKPRGRPNSASKTVASATAETVVEKAAVPETVEQEETKPTYVLDMAKGEFPEYPSGWFVENIDEAREVCRAVLSERLKAHGGNVVAVRKEMMDITQRGKVLDFNAEDCEKYYHATVDLIRAGDLN